MNTFRFAILCASLLTPRVLTAVEADGTDTSSVAAGTSITIHTDIDSARVIIDGTFIGLTPLNLDSLRIGWHRLVLQHYDIESWLTESISDSIEVSAGTARVLRYAFVQRMFLQSNPGGAEVVLGDSIAGLTPSVIRLVPGSETQQIRLQKAGYEPLTINPVSSLRGVVAVDLKGVWQSGDGRPSIFQETEMNGSKNLRLYIAGTATVLSGVAAAYFKVRADNRYDEYLQSANPALRSETNRLDTASGIALALTQVSLGLFTYFLLSD